MKNQRAWILVSMVVLILLLAGSAAAMSSTNYRLDWFVPLTGSGGPSTSARYSANVTAGQSVTGPASSANYQVGLGYWTGTPVKHHLFLPVLRR